MTWLPSQMRSRQTVHNIWVDSSTYLLPLRTDSLFRDSVFETRIVSSDLRPLLGGCPFESLISTQFFFQKLDPLNQQTSVENTLVRFENHITSASFIGWINPFLASLMSDSVRLFRVRISASSLPISMASYSILS